MFTPTQSQADALAAFERFLDGPEQVLILRGAAGTGKSTLLRHFMARLALRHIAALLMAPTGRAAQVLRNRIGLPAATIHSAIYTFDRMEELPAHGPHPERLRTIFRLNPEPMPSSGRVIIVDEASMIGDLHIQSEHLRYGSGRLLTDLLTFALEGHGAAGHKLVLVGDPCQLSPVGEEHSPALSAPYFQALGLRCIALDLREVVRQATDSPILAEATKVRQALETHSYRSFALGSNPAVPVPTAIQGVKAFVASYRSEDSEAAVLLSFTNADVKRFNESIREQLFPGHPAVQAGDRLLVVENNYRDDLLNGDLVTVTAVAPEGELIAIRGHSLILRKLQIRHRNIDGEWIQKEVLGIEDLLYGAARSLEPFQRQLLYVDFKQRHPDLKPGTPTFATALMQDPRFNALRVKFGYAMTVHKAQGGEWDTVILNLGGRRFRANEQGFRWAYTAITRARAHLMAIDPPSFQPAPIPWPAWQRSREARQQPGHRVFARLG